MWEVRVAAPTWRLPASWECLFARQSPCAFAYGSSSFHALADNVNPETAGWGPATRLEEIARGRGFGFTPVERGFRGMATGRLPGWPRLDGSSPAEAAPAVK